jgi:hypothetical protein
MRGDARGKSHTFASRLFSASYLFQGVLGLSTRM